MKHLLYALETRQPLTVSDSWCREHGYEIPVPKRIYRLSDLIDWMSVSVYDFDQVHFTPRSQDTAHNYALDGLLSAHPYNYTAPRCNSVLGTKE